MKRNRYANQTYSGFNWIVLIVVILAVIMFSALLFQMLSSNASDLGQKLMSDNPEAQRTFNQTVNAGWGVLRLSTVIPYVFVFAVILGLIIIGIRGQ